MKKLSKVSAASAVSVEDSVNLNGSDFTAEDVDAIKDAVDAFDRDVSRLTRAISDAFSEHIDLDDMPEVDMYTLGHDNVNVDMFCSAYVRSIQEMLRMSFLDHMSTAYERILNLNIDPTVSVYFEHDSHYGDSSAPTTFTKER